MKKFLTIALAILTFSAINIANAEFNLANKYKTAMYFVASVPIPIYSTGIYQEIKDIGATHLDYIFDATLSLYTDEVTFFGKIDNIVSWNVLPQNNIAKLNLGIDAKLYFPFFFNPYVPSILPQLYLSIDITPGLDDLHLYLVGTLDTVGWFNHDIKLSLAYDFGFLKSQVKPGIELGYKLMPIFLQNGNFDTMFANQIYAGLYLTY